MKIKTSELTGAALDWAAATADGWSIPSDFYPYLAIKTAMPATRWTELRPSRDWAQGGPIKARERISTLYDTDGRICCYVADHDYDPDENGFYKHIQFGDDELQATCRCFVASRLGDEVDVPEELCV